MMTWCACFDVQGADSSTELVTLQLLIAVFPCQHVASMLVPAAGLPTVAPRASDQSSNMLNVVCVPCVALSHSQVFDLQDGQQAACFQAADDTVNGVAFSPSLPLLVTSSGHRRYPLLPEDAWEEAAGAPDSSQLGASTSSSPSEVCDGSGLQTKGSAAAGLSMSTFHEGSGCNSLRLWRVQADWVPVAPPAEGDAAEDAGPS